MDERPELDISEIWSAMRRERDSTEPRSACRVKRIEKRWNSDLCVEQWSSTGTLHMVTVRAADLLAIDARTLPPTSDLNPNTAVASWLLVMIEEELDSAGPSPLKFTFDPNEPRPDD